MKIYVTDMKRTGYKLAIIVLVILIALSVKSQLASKYNQSDHSIKPLTVGDKVPGDLMIENIMNYVKTSARISDFRGKVLLIDFWGTYCGSCIEALPKFDSLQRQFGSQLQVLTVTNFDTKDKVAATLSRYKKTAHLTLPVVLNDKNLLASFPHELISHVVWIDKNGFVKGITGTEYAQAKNVQTILNGENVDWPVKIDVSQFDDTKPTFIYNKENFDFNKPKLTFQSALTTYIPGIDTKPRQMADSASQTMVMNSYNQEILQLCDGALQGSITGRINPKRLILKTSDSSRYFRMDKYRAEWERQNTYCYSIVLPITWTDQQITEVIKKDLSHWLDIGLGITVRREKRLTECLILTRNASIDRLLSNDPASQQISEETSSSIVLKNTEFFEFMWYLNEKASGVPWTVNETGIRDNEKITLEIKWSELSNYEALRQLLLQYDLKLDKGYRELEMYIVTDTENRSPARF